MENENKFISLLSDYGFKVAFADESNTLFLRKALQALIKSDTAIVEVEFLRNEFGGITEDSRGGIFDLLCIDEKRRTFIVEMQLAYYKHFIQRAKFYAFQRFNIMVEKGNYKFDSLTPIYCIGLLAKGIFPKSTEYYHFGRLMNQKGEELDDQITHIIVEIDKFEKKEFNIQSDLDKLIYIMKHLENIKGADQLPKFLTEDWIEQAMKKLDKSLMTPEQRMHYEMMMAKNGSIIQMMQEEKQQITEEVTKEVTEEVTKEVTKEVTEEVTKEVTKEVARKTAIKTAKKLKERGIGLSIISEATGLTSKEIENL